MLKTKEYLVWIGEPDKRYVAIRVNKDKSMCLEGDLPYLRAKQLLSKTFHPKFSWDDFALGSSLTVMMFLMFRVWGLV